MMRSPAVGVKNEVDMFSNPFDTMAMVAVPFPDLHSCGLPPQHQPSKSSTDRKRRRHIPIEQSIPREITAFPALPSSLLAATAPISMPKSHIHRTPSELCLEALTQRAEHENVRMYSRLVRGMQNTSHNQDLRVPLCFVSDVDNACVVGSARALSGKKMQGVVVQASNNDNLLVGAQRQEQDFGQQELTRRSGDADDDCGWDMSYVPIEEKNSASSRSRLPSESGVEAHASSRGLREPLPETIEDKGGDDEEDDCVFSMEM